MKLIRSDSWHTEWQSAQILHILHIHTYIKYHIYIYIYIDCWQRVLKTFPGSRYLRSKDEVVWRWHFLVHLDIYSSLFYLTKAQSLCLIVIGRDGGLSTLCHSCRLACQQRVLRGCLCPNDVAIWLGYFLVKLDI